MMQIDDNDYVAVICEGSSEVTVINMLLDGGHLCFGRDQLISEDVLPSTYFRNPQQFVDRYLTMDYAGAKIHVFLIQDRKDVRYKIKSPYLDKIRVITYVVTAPEIEMLIIHSLGLYNQYKKRSSKIKPSVFLAEELGMRSSEIKSCNYVKEFFADHDLLTAIREHKKKAPKLGKGEVFLADLLV